MQEKHTMPLNLVTKAGLKALADKKNTLNCNQIWYEYSFTAKSGVRIHKYTPS